MKKFLLILTFAAALWLASPATGQQIRWEEVNQSAESFIRSGKDVKHPPEEEGLEIFARNGYIYVVSDHEVPVRVFSILGHLIGEGKLRQGVYRMPIKARGVYIVKAGMATLRVTL